MVDQPKEAAYIAEGVAFETRCEIAIRSLHELKRSLEEILDGDLKHLQKRREETDVRKKSLGPAARKVLEQWLEADLAIISQSSQEMLVIAWEGGLTNLRLICGSDAVDFALLALKHERKGN